MGCYQEEHKMKKHLSIFLIILFILSIIFHIEEWVNNPILHIKNLSHAGAFGLGSFHPLIFALLVYFIFIIPFAIFIKIKKKISKK